MHQRRSARTTASVLPLSLRYGRLNPSPAQLPPEVGAVVALVSGQAGWALPRPALGSGHLYSIYYFKPYSDLGYISSGHQGSHRESITFRHQVHGAPFTFPAVGDISTPFARHKAAIQKCLV